MLQHLSSSVGWLVLGMASCWLFCTGTAVQANVLIVRQVLLQQHIRNEPVCGTAGLKQPLLILFTRG